MKELTQEKLKELLHYDPGTGVFTWKTGRRGVNKDHVAGAPRKRGDIVICIDYANYFAHRLAWLYVTGSWPTHKIDHINRNPGDNRWFNLREATISLNGANRAVRTPSGLKGAYKTNNRWYAMITAGGVSRYLGMFATAEDAHAAYMQEAKQAFGEFASN